MAGQKSVETSVEKAVGEAFGSRDTSRGSRNASRALVLRFATAVLLVCGVGAAAASAGVLPTGVQRIAHDYFGIGRVSAPSTHVPSSSVATASPARGSNGGDGNGNGAAAPSAATSATPRNSDVVVALCQKITQGRGGNWKSGLSATDQATLIAAAGDEHKVRRYCGRLLKGAGTSTNGKGSNPDPSPAATNSHRPAATGTPSPVPSVRPDKPRGKAHASHSAAAHGGGG